MKTALALVVGFTLSLLPIAAMVYQAMQPIAQALGMIAQ